jgi:hypothetical protein
MAVCLMNALSLAGIKSRTDRDNSREREARGNWISGDVYEEIDGDVY